MLIGGHRNGVLAAMERENPENLLLLGIAVGISTWILIPTYFCFVPL
jgi:hypothetical protein